jgi:hypothetical protein
MTDETGKKEPILRDADEEPDDTGAEVPDVREAEVPEG